LTTYDWGGLTSDSHQHQLETRCLRAASPRKQQVVVIVIIACVTSCLTLITRRGNRQTTNMWGQRVNSRKFDYRLSGNALAQPGFCVEGAPAENGFWCILSLKNESGMTSLIFFVIFIAHI